MHQSKLKRITLGVLLALLPFVANAAGLGKLNVMSGLGEPLSAEIEVLSTNAEELSELTAAIAPEEAYTLQGLERPGFHSQIRVEVKKKSNGNPVLKLTTITPVTDPFLDMLVQVDWPTGRLIREFTLLLDPPSYSNPSIASPTVSSNSSSTNATTNQAAAANPPLPKTTNKKTSRRASKKAPSAQAAETKADVTEPAPVDASASSAAGSSQAATSGEPSIKTEKGDSLSTIARQNQLDDVSLDQMLIGIFRANKKAFAGDNMNRLKVGQLVRIPTADELKAISPKDATREVKVQASDWNEYRNKLAGKVAETEVTRDEAPAGQQSSSGKITAPAQDKSLPEATGPRDVVKLSKSDTGVSKDIGATKQASADAKAMQDKLTALQEEATAREKSVKEANERAAALEKQIQDMQKLLTLKSQAISDMQKNSAAATAPAGVKPTETPAVEAPKPAEIAKVETPASADTGKNADGTAANAQPAPEAAPEQKAPVVATEAKPEAEIKKPTVQAAVVPAVPPADSEEPGLIDSLLEDPLPLGLAALLAVLLGGWLFLRNKRKKGLDGFEKSILTSGGLKANTVFGNTLGGNVNTGDTSFLTDFSQSSSGMIDTNDVDPIAEAEVYMAYGRDKQAEEILRDAISKEPTRYELHLKLLEVYAGRQDISAFEATAGELYTSLGAQDPVWAKVAELGRQVEPENPLYQGVASPEAGAFVATNSMLSDADLDSNASTENQSLDFALDSEPQDDYKLSGNGDADANDSLDASDISGSFNPNVAEDAELDFDLDKNSAVSTFESTGSFNETSPNLGSSAKLAENELDFPLDGGDESSQNDVAQTQTANSNEMEFDLGPKEDEAVSDSGSSGLDVMPPDLESTVQLDLSETADSGLSFPVEDLPTFDNPSFESDSDKTSPPAESESSVPEISFDLPEIGIETEAVKSGDPVNESAELELPDFDVSSNIPENSAETDADSITEDIVFESVAAEDNALDLDFDLDLGASDNASTQTPEPNAPELDLSGISFDLDDASAETSNTTLSQDGNVEGTLGAESSEVDTKLDLVTAYIDMGDNEGAKELLDEIMQEGGPGQRLRAQDILKTLS